MMTTTIRASRPTALIVLASVALLLAPSRAVAAFEVTWPDARSAAMSGCSLDAAEDLVDLRADGRTGEGSRAQWSARLSGGELFGLPEAAGGAARIEVAFGKTAVALEMDGVGGALYRERSLGLRVGRRTSEDLMAWVALRGLGVGARGVPDAWTVGLDTGIARRLLGRIVIAVRFDRLNAPSVGDSPVARTARLTSSLHLDRITLAAGTVWIEDLEPSLALAAEVELADAFRFRAGVGTEPATFSCGLGIGVRRRSTLRPVVDLAWRWHPELGVSSFASISFHR